MEGVPSEVSEWWKGQAQFFFLNEKASELPQPTWDKGALFFQQEILECPLADNFRSPLLDFRNLLEKLKSSSSIEIWWQTHISQFRDLKKQQQSASIASPNPSLRLSGVTKALLGFFGNIFFTEFHRVRDELSYFQARAAFTRAVDSLLHASQFCDSTKSVTLPALFHLKAAEIYFSFLMQTHESLSEFSIETWFSIDCRGALSLGIHYLARAVEIDPKITKNPFFRANLKDLEGILQIIKKIDIEKDFKADELQKAFNQFRLDSNNIVLLEKQCPITPPVVVNLAPLSMKFSVMHMPITDPLIDISYQEQLDLFLFHACRDGVVELLADAFDHGADINACVPPNGYSPLMGATLGNHFEIVESLIQRKANVNATFHGILSTVLGAACKNQNIEIINLLIKSGARWELGDNPPLHVATYFNRYKVLELLLSSAADVNASSKHGLPLHIACRYGYLEAANILLKAKADFNALEQGHTPMNVACMYGNVEIAKILVEAKADITLDNDTRQTPLYTACLHGNVRCVAFLLENKANVNHVSQARGTGTAVYIASFKGFPRVLRLLIEHNADVNLVNKQGSQTPACTACVQRNEKILKILIDAKADLNAATSSGDTPLLIASQSGQVKIAELLLDSNANIELTKTEINRGPLHAACFRGHQDVVKLLLERKANVNSNVNPQSPLFHACWSGNFEICKMLIGAKANLDATDKDQRNSPLFIATTYGYQKVLALLLENKATLHHSGTSDLDLAMICNRPNVISILKASGSKKRKLAFFEVLKDPYWQNAVQTFYEEMADQPPSELVDLLNINPLGSVFALPVCSKKTVNTLIDQSLFNTFAYSISKDSKSYEFQKWDPAQGVPRHLTVTRTDYGFRSIGDPSPYLSIEEYAANSKFTKASYLPEFGVSWLVELAEIKKEAFLFLQLCAKFGEDTPFHYSKMPREIFRIVLEMASFFFPVFKCKDFEEIVPIEIYRNDCDLPTLWIRVPNNATLGECLTLVGNLVKKERPDINWYLRFRRVARRKNGTNRPMNVLTDLTQSIEKITMLYLEQDTEPTFSGLPEDFAFEKVFMTVRYFDDRTKKPRAVRDIYVPSSTTIRSLKKYLAPLVGHPANTIVLVEEETPRVFNLMKNEDTSISAYQMVSGDLIYIEYHPTLSPFSESKTKKYFLKKQ